MHKLLFAAKVQLKTFRFEFDIIFSPPIRRCQKKQSKSLKITMTGNQLNMPISLINLNNKINNSMTNTRSSKENKG